MPEEQSAMSPETRWGKELISWELKKETIRPPRTFLWYILFGLILLGFLLFAVWTQNFLFAILIVIFAFILVFERYNPTPSVKFGIYETGVAVNDHFYTFSEFKSFRVMYDPPVKNLYLIRDTYLNPFMKFPLEDQDPLLIREMLLEVLPEDLDKEGEYLSDRIQRWFKL